MRSGRLTAAAAVIALASILVLSVSCQRSPQIEKKLKLPVPDLNNTLTNALSDTSDLARMDRDIRVFMQEWNIKGMSVSVMRNDSLIYSKGYGWADEAKKVEMTPGTILRMASVSKLITAAGIMKLKEEGKLQLSDKVFGERGILNDSTYIGVITDSLYYRMTVEDLLRHKGGFSTRSGDPMFSTRTIMLQNRLKSAPDHATLLRTQLKKRLSFTPGTSQYYSNLGYLLLSMIIEEVTGEDYETWMQEHILKPAHCIDFRMARNYYPERYANETRYYVQPNDEPVQEYNNSGKMVVRCYGGNDINALSGAGAWVASTPELARFVASIDGRPEVPDILSEESVMEMTRYIDTETYSLGWNDTKPDGEWTRTGTFSGTSALVKYYPDGECWILITNTSTWKGPSFSKYSSELFRKCRGRYSSLLPARDFFFVEEENQPSQK